MSIPAIRVSHLSFFLLGLAALQLAVPENAVAQHVNIIVAADSPIQALSEEEVLQIFTARRLRWDDARLSVALNPKDEDEYERFARRLTGRSSRALGLTWLEAGYREAVPEPSLVDDDQQMIDYVAETRGAVGYTQQSVLPGSVRVVHRLVPSGSR